MYLYVSRLSTSHYCRHNFSTSALPLTELWEKCRSLGFSAAAIFPCLDKPIIRTNYGILCRFILYNRISTLQPFMSHNTEKRHSFGLWTCLKSNRYFLFSWFQLFCYYYYFVGWRFIFLLNFSKCRLTIDATPRSVLYIRSILEVRMLR